MLELEFDPAVVTVDAIQRAAYRMSDRMSIDVQTEPNLRVTIHTGDTAPAEEITADFRNEVLDQTLRERIRHETEAARNVILALAFSNTEVLAED